MLKHACGIPACDRRFAKPSALKFPTVWVIYISKIAVCYLESHTLFIPTFPLSKDIAWVWKVPLAWSLKQGATVPLRDNDSWGGGREVEGTHSILNLAGGAGSSTQREPGSQIWGMPWRDGWAWGLGRPRRSSSCAQRPLLVSARTQMRPDILTLLRFAASAQVFTHRHTHTFPKSFFLLLPPQSLPQSDLPFFSPYCVCFIWCQHIKVPNHQSGGYLLGDIKSTTIVPACVEKKIKQEFFTRITANDCKRSLIRRFLRYYTISRNEPIGLFLDDTDLQCSMRSDMLIQKHVLLVPLTELGAVSNQTKKEKIYIYI